eukprot:gnl/MRDRNA2_/MRDRNA2_71022_c0_seq1.p1 gnl/MRDRNA2_/MRDRNA2_71022_c0~~gnl/MRDRNA2_/MRDRNA2_71022_c0_seq1.p1  ORF type:complete len:253 (+),score=35.30 gnl/MRDRNA2_/MRDRNA2_71022_c0_seq1:59-817(+)
MDRISEIIIACLLARKSNAYDPSLCPKYQPDIGNPLRFKFEQYDQVKYVDAKQVAIEPNQSFGGIVGTCDLTKNLACPWHLGPTDCIDNHCFCKTRFCGYPSVAGEFTSIAKQRYCVAQIPDRVCNDFSTAAIQCGSKSALCDHGFCLCDWGEFYNGSAGQCQNNEMDGIATEEGKSSEGKMQELHVVHCDNAFCINIVSIFSAVVALTAFTAGVLTMCCKLRGSVMEDNTYWQLPSTVSSKSSDKNSRSPL